MGVSNLEELIASSKKAQRNRRIGRPIKIFVRVGLLYLVWLYSVRAAVIWFFISLAWVMLKLVTAYLTIRKINKLPSLTRSSKKKYGNFTGADIYEIVDDICSKTDASKCFQVKFLDDKTCNMLTTVGLLQRFRRRERLIVIFEGLLYVASEKEIRAVVAHEIGHHHVPYVTRTIYDEYWADYYASKLIDPVALVNALLKIDHSNYFFVAFVCRCSHWADFLLPQEHVNKQFWEFVFNNVKLPFQSTKQATKQAKQLVYDYAEKNNIALNKRNAITRWFYHMKVKTRKIPLGRKELSGHPFIQWEVYDNRIKNNYLDKYELLQLCEALTNTEQSTVSKYDFLLRRKQTHPTLNNRIKFIVENFLVAKDGDAYPAV